MQPALCQLAAIIPAAGLSSRMGAYKPLLPLGRSTIIETAISSCLAAGISQIIVVVGHRERELAQVLEPWPVQIIRNPAYQDGMFSSIVAGIAALPRPCDSWFLLPGDTPLIRTNTFDTLTTAWLRSRAEVAYPVYNGRKGHPPLISSDLSAAILTWNQPGGLRSCLRALASSAVDVPVNDPGILLDADTPMDYAQLQSLLDHLPQMTAQRMLGDNLGKLSVSSNRQGGAVMKKQDQLQQRKEHMMSQAKTQGQQKKQVKNSQQQLQTEQQLTMQQNPQMPLIPQQNTAPPANSQQIRCSISNCHYWTQGNNCSAQQVLVTSQTMAKGLKPTYDAPIATQLAMTPVSGAIESCCNTFAPAGSNSAFQDGVTKIKQQ